MIDPAELRALFDRAVPLPAAARSVFLDNACGDNPELRTRLDRLLAAHDRTGSVFKTRAPEERADPNAAIEPRAAASLTPGARLGPYVITAALGAGGMGEVYKGCDTRLDRSVAIKVLPPGVTSDPSARQRLEREARAAAALAHPHICTLLDIGRQDDVDYLVMEFLDGETLAARLIRGKLPLEDALTYATEIAEALEAAHQAGIVHRDLKPGNVMSTKGGAKLLDFGLAKRGRRVVSSELPTQSEPVTRDGVIFGTVQYMAPEQLEGKAADERTDIFTFGAVLYEMVTGRRAFEGGSDASLIGNILHTQPPSLATIEPTAPAALDDVVRGCLAKDPSGRWSSMSEVRTQLLAARALLPVLGTRAQPSTGVATRVLGRIWISIAAASVIVGTAGVAWRWLPRTATTTSQVERAPVQRNLTRLTFDDGLQTDPTFSPDGRFIAYASDKGGNFDIWVQPIAGGDAVQVTKSPAHDLEPRWSPDGSTIAFRSDRDGGGIYLVPALGGMARRLVDGAGHPSWSSDGRKIQYVAYGPQGARLHELPVTGGAARQVFPEFTRTGSWSWIGFHPDGRASFLGMHAIEGWGFYTVSHDGTAHASAMPNMPEALNDMVHNGGRGQRFQWNDSGTRLFLQSADNTAVWNVWRVDVEPSTLQWTSFERLTTGAGKDMSLAISPEQSRVAFSTQRATERLWRFVLNPTRRHVSAGRPVTEEGSTAGGFDVTADARTIVFTLMRPGLYAVNLWARQIDTGRSELIAESAQGARWSPDGRAFTYLRFRPKTTDKKTGAIQNAIAIREPGGPERLVTPWTTAWTYPVDWAPDRRSILSVNGSRLELRRVGNQQEPSRLVLARKGRFSDARFSPNGRWLAFAADTLDNADASELAIVTADGAPDRQPTAAVPADSLLSKPRWSPNGRRLYFLKRTASDHLNVWAVDIDPDRGRMSGDTFPITRFESPTYFIPYGSAWMDLTVLEQYVFVPVRTAAGNLWLLDHADK